MTGGMVGLRAGGTSDFAVGHPDLVEDLEDVDVVDLELAVVEHDLGAPVQEGPDVEGPGERHQATPAATGWPPTRARLEPGHDLLGEQAHASRARTAAARTSMNWWMKLMPSKPTFSQARMASPRRRRASPSSRP